MNGIGRIFLVPFRVQVTLVLALFVSLFLLLLEIGWAHATTYLVLSVLLGLAFILNVNIGARGRMSFYVRSDRADVTTLQSRNDIAALAALNADPFLAPISRPLLIPVRSSLLTFVLLSGLWWVWICILLALVQVITGRLVLHVSLLELAAGQVRRDRTASALLLDLRSGQPVHGQYYVYLRPFAITGQLHGEDPHAMETAVRGRHPVDEYSTQGERIGAEFPLINLNVSLGAQRSASELNPEWEAIFEKGFRRLGTLVALGRPGESLGAGRILTGEDDWQETLVQLNWGATGFLIIPSSNPGTLWEIRWLREALAFKGCYFFVPGPQPGKCDWTSWQHLRETLLPVLRLPHHLGTPAMFAMDGDGRPHVAAMIGSVLRTGGSAMRNFITAATMEDALQTLSTVASRSQEPKIRELIQVAGRFLEALASGRENVLAFDSVTDDLRRFLCGLDDSALSQLGQCNGLGRIPDTEEVYHHELAGRDVLTVRQDGFVDDKHLVFYVTIEGGDSRVVGFRFLPYEEDLRYREYVGSLAGSAGDNPREQPHAAGNRHAGSSTIR